MLQEIDTSKGVVGYPEIEISAAASQAVNNTLKQNNLQNFFLRISSVNCGCGSARFDLGLDNIIGEADTIFSSGGVKFVVEKESIDSLSGVSIDFVHDSERGAGFVVKKPSASQGNCGCGGCGGDANEH